MTIVEPELTNEVKIMVQKIGISMDDWLYKEVENKRGDTGRSEFICEMIARGLGFSKPAQPEQAEVSE